MNIKPIGIFDSGIGGLTVVREIIKTLPQESLIYIGDTARVPYGTRGQETIEKFACELASFLLKKDVKFLVVACNTISATCLAKIQAISSVPVLGVIKPAAQKALDATKTNTVAIIGTRATIESKAYDQELKKLNPKVKILKQVCPLFVPIVEEGLGGSEVAKLAAKEYLGKLKESKMDTLILGCTHYPLLKTAVQDVVGTNVALVDSAEPTALALRKKLKELELLNNGSPRYEFYVTDAPQRVLEVANLFFDNNLPGKFEKIDLKEISQNPT